MLSFCFLGNTKHLSKNNVKFSTGIFEFYCHTVPNQFSVPHLFLEGTEFFTGNGWKVLICEVAL